MERSEKRLWSSARQNVSAECERDGSLLEAAGNACGRAGSVTTRHVDTVRVKVLLVHEHLLAALGCFFNHGRFDLGLARVNAFLNDGMR